MSAFLRRLLTVSAFIIGITSSLSAENLLPSEDFKKDIGGTTITGWTITGDNKSTVTVVDTAGTAVAKITSAEPTTKLVEFRRPKAEGVSTYTLTGRIRGVDIVLGNEGWKSGRVALQFHKTVDGKNTRVQDKAITVPAGSSEWKNFTLTATHDDFERVMVHFGFIGNSSGTVEVTDLKLVAGAP